MQVTFTRPPGITYQWLELAVATGRTFANPFDPQEVEVWAVFAGPGGAQRVQGFWYQGFARRLETDAGTRSAAGGRQVLVPTGEQGWRIRYTPQVPGVYTCRVFLRDRDGTVTVAEGPAFTVAPGHHTGFVRISRHDPAYFACDNGDLYFPMGENMGWGNAGRTYDYDVWCRRLAAAGGNCIRVWMSSWAFAIEGPEGGPGDYGPRLDRAWELDYLFGLCEELGIRIVLVLVNHGSVSTFCNPDWDRNAYNRQNPGGFLDQAAAFFTDAQARDLFRRRLRYIVARWAHSPSLLAWELFNEVDLTDGWRQCKGAVAEWHGEMARYIRSLDPYGHLITSSYMGDTLDPLLWHLPELDFVQYHTYGHRDLVPHIAAAVSHLAQYGRPVCVAEFGTDTRGADTNDREGVWLHEGIWAAVFAKAAGAAWPWWWDTCVHPLDLYRHWLGLSRFLAGEALDREHYQPVQPACQGAQAYALASPRRILLWLKNPAWTWSAAPGPYPVATGVEVTVDAVGTWQVEWWDTGNGTVVERGEVAAEPKGLVLSRPVLPTDLAAKLVRMG